MKELKRINLFLTGSLKPLEKDRLSGSVRTDTLTKVDNKSESPPSSKRSKKDVKSEANSVLDKNGKQGKALYLDLLFLKKK